MRRVVITGLGIVSCLGNDRETVSTSLRELRSGIREIPAYIEHGLRCHVAGVPDIDLDAVIDPKKSFTCSGRCESQRSSS